jgi:hypothetical protein
MSTNNDNEPAVDVTEPYRRPELRTINAEAAESRKEAEAKYGQCWDTAEMQRDFAVDSFMAPYVGVTRKSDGKKGTLKFQHSPRIYFGFEEA